MRFLSIITSLAPSDGGPVECSLQLQSNLGKLGHYADVVTLNGPNAPWIKKLGFKPICLGKSDRGERINPALGHFLRRNLHTYDGAVLHGIWTFQNIAFLRAWDHQCPFSIFPHGMLDPYFIRNFPIKHIKKTLYYRSVCVPLFKKAQAVLFTCEEERRLASTSYMPAVGRRVVVRYGIDDPGLLPRDRDSRLAALDASLPGGKETILYLGRIHPKKGCDMLITALARLAARAPHIHLAMVGPGDPAFVNSLKEMAEKLGVTDRVSWPGPAFGKEKWRWYNQASAFILPSHMENFGMAVAEALSQGCPVLISDRVNIYGSILRAKAGYVAPDTLGGTTELLERWMLTPSSERSAMTENARRLFVNEFQAIQTAEDLVKVFQTNDASSDEVLATPVPTSFRSQR